MISHVILLLQPYGNTPALQIFLDLADGVGFEVKNAGGKYSVSFTNTQRIIQVFQRARATAGDYGNGYGLADNAVQLDIIPRLLAIGIPTGKQQLACPKLNGTFCPTDSVYTR